MTEDIKVDYEQVRKLASLQCTIEEIAAWFNITQSHFRRLMANDVELRNIIERAQANGRISLRRQQWKQATGFGPAAVQMSIWLGKQVLGQTDKSQIDIDATVRVETRSASDKFLLNFNHDLLLPNERIDLAELCDLVDERGINRLSNYERIRFFELVGKGNPDIIDVEPEPVQALPPPDKDVD